MLQLWDAQTGQTVSGTLPLSRMLDSLSYSAVAQRLAVLDGGQVRLFDCAPATPVELNSWPAVEGCQLHLSPDGEQLLLSRRTRIELVQAPDGKLIVTLPHSNQIRHAAFHPDGKRLLTVCDDLAVRLWDRQTGQLLAPPMWHTDIPVFGAFSPDGRLAVTTSYDGTARLWDVATGQPAMAPLNHIGLVSYAGFSPDGRQLVTYSERGARVWDLATGRAVTAPMPSPATVTYLDFLPDNYHLLMVLADRSAIYWELPSGLPLTLPGPKHGSSPNASARGMDQLPVETRPVAELAKLAWLLAGQEVHEESGLVPVEAARLQLAWESRPR